MIFNLKEISNVMRLRVCLENNVQYRGLYPIPEQDFKDAVRIKVERVRFASKVVCAPNSRDPLRAALCFCDANHPHMHNFTDQPLDDQLLARLRLSRNCTKITTFARYSGRQFDRSAHNLDCGRNWDRDGRDCLSWTAQHRESLL